MTDEKRSEQSAEEEIEDIEAPTTMEDDVVGGGMTKQEFVNQVASRHQLSGGRDIGEVVP
jgi:hypothetical protein